MLQIKTSDVKKVRTGPGPGSCETSSAAHVLTAASGGRVARAADLAVPRRIDHGPRLDVADLAAHVPAIVGIERARRRSPGRRTAGEPPRGASPRLPAPPGGVAVASGPWGGTRPSRHRRPGTADVPASATTTDPPGPDASTVRCSSSRGSSPRSPLGVPPRRSNVPGSYNPLSRGHERVPVVPAEQHPHREDADVDAVGGDGLGGVPALLELPELLLAPAADVGLGDSQGPLVPSPRFTERRDVGWLLRSGAHRLDVAFRPVAETRKTTLACGNNEVGAGGIEPPTSAL
ncbi:hypothetical protein BH20ACT9_BH20ACT9_09910 [soil metagenome]